MEWVTARPWPFHKDSAFRRQRLMAIWKVNMEHLVQVPSGNRDRLLCPRNMHRQGIQ